MKEVARYTRNTDRKTLAGQAFEKLPGAQKERNTQKRGWTRLDLKVQEHEKYGKFRKDGGGGWIRTNVGLANGFTVRKTPRKNNDLVRKCCICVAVS